MTWIKLEEFKPPTHEIILFRDRHGNEHYGVLCGNLSKKEHRNKFWCHLDQRTYEQDEIIYWCEIPINKHILGNKLDFSANVNSFLWARTMEIESKILEEFKQHQLENPDWEVEAFVSIAVRNVIHKIISNLRVLD